MIIFGSTLIYRPASRGRNKSKKSRKFDRNKKVSTMKMMAVKGNKTTTGGYVLNGDATALDHGRPIARHHDEASCGQCGENGLIEGTAGTFGLGNTRGMCDGDIVTCRCPRGANRVIAQSTLYYKD
jgi:uncharacterized Zn-binding protein involved in type VI secretion